MEVVKVEAKTKEDGLKQLLKKLNAQESEVIYNVKEIKGRLFKGTTYEVEGFLKVDLISEAEEFLKTILKGMGVEASTEVKNEENGTIIKMYTSNNPIIIGRNGQNLTALTVLVRQFMKKYAPFNAPKIILDVEDYKDRQVKRIERLAKNLAREVLKTKVDVEMEAMNSYERRIVHNILTDFKGIKTESVGEEPNRKVVIKYVK